MKLPVSISSSVSCLDTEDLANKAYNGLVGVMNLVETNKAGVREMIVLGGKEKDMDVFQPLLDGIYIPGSPRKYWNGYVDPTDFPLPKHGCVYCATKSSDVFQFVSIKQINKLPKKVVCVCAQPQFIFKFIQVSVDIPGRVSPHCNISYFCVDSAGSVYAAFDLRKLRYGEYAPAEIIKHDRANLSSYAAGAISLLADRRYLWNIKTTEQIRRNVHAVVNFGVEEELVKSLVFARDEPLTASGRKRPILHWVAAHKRRIEQKIDIDVKRYLRGVTQFKIEGLNFEITMPTKDANV